MPETGSLSPEINEQLETVGTADVVIGVPALQNTEDLHWATKLAGIGQRVVIAFPKTVPSVDSSQLAGPQFLRYEFTSGDRHLNPPTSLDGSFLEVFQISQRVGAKCCCVWNGNPQDLTFEVIERLVAPALKEGFDLVTPCYLEKKFGSLVNGSIVYPALRALYGKKISFSMAIDLAFSAQFVDRLLQVDPKTRRTRWQQWIATEAICAGLKICQVNLPVEPPRPPESADVSSILTIVLGRLFSDLERNAAYWQRSNGSLPVTTFGEAVRREERAEVAVDVQPMIETFQLGYRNLREIWNLALPPATLVDLKKLTMLPATTFRMPDDLWVRVIYDFALAHRQRSINREHLLRAMTPLYLGWVASHAQELKDAPPSAVRANLESLALAYERQKPYLLSRWRWPDRFNP